MRKMNPFTAVQEIERSLLRITCDGKNLEIHLSPVNISPAEMADLIDNTADVTTAKDPVADLTDQNERLKLELKEANEALRSAHSVAKRGGAHTDWKNFTKRLENILHRQHLFMYPNRYASGDPQPITEDEVKLPSSAWVTQDRVGARDSDEFRWSSNVDLGDFRWRKVGNHPGVRGVIHGTTYPGGDTFELRCRPDELPPVKESAERSREKPSPKELEFTYDWPDRVGIWAVKQSGAGHHQHFWLQMPTELDIKHRPERSNYKYAFICPLPVVKS